MTHLLVPAECPCLNTLCDCLQEEQREEKRQQKEAEKKRREQEREERVRIERAEREAAREAVRLEKQVCFIDSGAAHGP